MYDPAEADDGVRILVDRLWPRGLSRSDAHLDAWERDVAPSPDLRKWFGHDRSLYAEFITRYQLELDDPTRAAAFDRLREHATDGTLTLLTATRDIEHCHATVLRDLLS
ncbi:MAG: DUF488 domain-containing protein [Jiangellaceae bacterium]